MSAIAESYSGCYSESIFIKAIAYHTREWSINHRFDCDKELLNILEKIHAFTSHSVWLYRSPTHKDSEEVIKMILDASFVLKTRCPDLWILYQACMEAREIDSSRRIRHHLDAQEVPKVITLFVPMKEDESQPKTTNKTDNVSDATLHGPDVKIEPVHVTSEKTNNETEDNDDVETQPEIEDINDDDDDDEEEFDIVLHIPNPPPPPNAPKKRQRNEHKCLKCIQPKRLHFS